MSAVPAGWYPDVSQPGTERWWDGLVWTEHVQQAHQPVVADIPVEDLVVGADAQYTTPDLNADEERFFQEQASALFNDPANFTDESTPFIVPGTSNLAALAEDEVGGRGVKAILVGALLIAVTFAIVIPAVDMFAKEGDTAAQATIVDVRYHHEDVNEEKDCSPVAEFGAEGKTYTAVTGFSGPCEYSTGEKIAVTYDEANPAGTGRLKLENTAIYALVPILFGTGRVVTLLVGIALAVKGSLSALGLFTRVGELVARRRESRVA